MNPPWEITDFWQYPSDAIIRLTGTSDAAGLSKSTARQRKSFYHKKKHHKPEIWSYTLLFFRQFNSPLVLLLVFAGLLSFSFGETKDGIILLTILLLTSLVGFAQEFRANRAVKRLQSSLRLKTTVIRAGVSHQIPFDELVPGDLLDLKAGDIIPADSYLLEEKDVHVNEAALTGESFAREKNVGSLPLETALADRTNCLFAGTSVLSGRAKAVVVLPADKSLMGTMSAHLAQMEPESAFQKGVRSFGYLLMKMTFILSTGILLFSLFGGKPLFSSLLFAIALAVGLTPELLPAILITNLSLGALLMAKKKVLVKKLAAIQDLGAISILCSDKTGTLTTGEVQLAASLRWDGTPSLLVKQLACWNAFFESGFSNPIDEALRKETKNLAEGVRKLDEVPYDFTRKRLSLLVESPEKKVKMVTKGSYDTILNVCTMVNQEPIEDRRKALDILYSEYCSNGYRVLAVASKEMQDNATIHQEDESNMTFEGFLLLEDPPKEEVADRIQELEALGVQLKIITGDNRLAALHLASQIGINAENILTGGEIHQLEEAALQLKARTTQLFAEIEPFQKERIIKALQRDGTVVGYLGDGINDASALKAADVGISVDSAVDIAKESADIVLLEKDLKVLCTGILDGRRTHANTLKYIFITTSANFGNMFSLAGISGFLSWLPLLPKQILALNFLSDLPALTISTDRVDEQQLQQPQKWDIQLIKRFMVLFGIQSSLFDFLTFALLLWYFKVTETSFQTSWFLESVLTEILVLLILRTRGSIFKSLPSTALLVTCLLTLVTAIALPFLSLGSVIGLQPLPLPLLFSMTGIALFYGILLETTKKRFFQAYERKTS